jgi:hypothetical protein
MQLPNVCKSFRFKISHFANGDDFDQNIVLLLYVSNRVPLMLLICLSNMGRGKEKKRRACYSGQSKRVTNTYLAGTYKKKVAEVPDIIMTS